jgi:hypothetical protein
MEFRLFDDALKDLDLLWKWNGREEFTRTVQNMEGKC